MRQEDWGTTSHCMMLFSLYEIRNSLFFMTLLKMQGKKKQKQKQKENQLCQHSARIERGRGKAEGEGEMVVTSYV